jgi:hypothetical protein
VRTLGPDRVRLGAVALGVAALLLAVFPLIRQFFPLDPTSPEPTLIVASGAITSARWQTHILPLIGQLYLAGTTDIAPIVGPIYRGPSVVVFLLGLLLLAIGSIYLAVAIWQTRLLPRWAGIIFGMGLALWFPPFPRMVRVVDGVLIGIGGIWLAYSVWQGARPAPNHPLQRTGSAGR